MVDISFQAEANRLLFVAKRLCGKTTGHLIDMYHPCRKPESLDKDIRRQMFGSLWLLC